GPAGVLEAVEKLVKATDRPISAVPNAGLPKDVGDRKIYLASPEYMASYARRMIEAGARIVGGCCGTPPEPIQEVRDYVARVGPRAQSRMGVLPSAILIQKEVGIETVIHYCCRDRNLLGMLSDILGAHAAGLRNILIITGDPPKMGPYPEATAVFDIDSIGLTNLVFRLNHGLDPGNNPIGAPTQWAIGVGVNPGAVDLDRGLYRFAWEVGAGRGGEDRPRDVPAGEGERTGRAGERAVRAGGGGAGGVRVAVP